MASFGGADESPPSFPRQRREEATEFNAGIRTESDEKMSSEEQANPMAESGVTIPSDSEHYSATEELSTSPPSSSSPPLILYQPPSIWGVIRGAAINLLLPFINGMMLGFGELFAHEAAFRLGWGGTRVSYDSRPRRRSS